MNRFVLLAATLLLSLTLGLHWVVLQSVAWTAMLIERSRSASFASALQTTFDGQHPCKLCRVVEAGKSAEKAPEAPLKLPKLEGFSTGAITVAVVPPRIAPAALRERPGLNARTERPLLPPPRPV